MFGLLLVSRFPEFFGVCLLRILRVMGCYRLVVYELAWFWVSCWGCGLCASLGDGLLFVVKFRLGFVLILVLRVLVFPMLWVWCSAVAIWVVLR